MLSLLKYIWHMYGDFPSFSIGWQRKTSEICSSTLNNVQKIRRYLFVWVFIHTHNWVKIENLSSFFFWMNMGGATSFLLWKRNAFWLAPVWYLEPIKHDGLSSTINCDVCQGFVWSSVFTKPPRCADVQPSGPGNL